MNTILSALIFSVLLAVLITLPVYLHERRLLRLAKAKLEISKTVTAMEELMLSGKLAMGETCHDKVFKTMVAVQASDSYSVPWKLWEMAPSNEEREVRKKLHGEITAKGSEVGDLMGRFTYSYFLAYSYRRPFLCKCFILWVLLFDIGITGVITAFLAFRHWARRYQAAKRRMGEWLVAREMTSQALSNQGNHFLHTSDVIG
jgi:hypothetical protein